ncbi:RNA polymerase sigma factor [Paraburkholderia solisilvae]|uniref:ECF RNA polymerase sigma factor SigE n=1 Tax=Paraburkholderia solisilvae TaxID=624376 RepID=A0A6J5DZS6_9BURK|nr:RNA polymerase sigma factor [Paraburkholderia solisilvae]CAB3758964.1 ECF RNA polymerase sigma factor SigE [Paraburkholderia solisilvae]
MLATTTELAGSLTDLLPRLWAFAWRITGDRLEAEELTQKTCLCARKHVGPGPHRMRPLCRLYTIAYRIWSDDLRSRSTRERANATPLADSPAGPPVQRGQHGAHPAAPDPSSDALSQRIVAAVDQLPHAQRIAMLLVAIEALSYAEAAHVLDVPVHTVMSRVARARQALGRTFAAQPDRCGKHTVR